MSIFNETYSDGTQMTPWKFAAAVTAGAVIGTAVFVAKTKVDDWKLQRWMKKHNWPV